MNVRQRFEQEMPGKVFLDTDIQIMEAYFHEKGWLAAGDRLLKLEKPGEGNMNKVLRATTQSGSFIVKQARPWVEKYPEYAAPVERLEVEATFFQIANGIPALSPYTPDILDFDAENHIMAVEDLGTGKGYTAIYEPGNLLTAAEVADLATYLSLLHAWKPAPGAPAFPRNLKLRKDLNHIHIFKFPFDSNNGLPLDDIQAGLGEAALPFQHHAVLKTRIAELGDCYIDEGPCLLHGDFYPGSWLATSSGLKVIDPEFAFMGPAEFDLGVLMAHLMLAEQGEEIIADLLNAYQQGDRFDLSLAYAFAGTEILRRLIGIAQLPLSLEVSQKTDLMNQAAEWILPPNQ